MDASAVTDDFYAKLPVFRDFTQVMDSTLFRPLPDGWLVGVADVVQSTKAIHEHRYKAVNMAGAAVIVAITNALAGPLWRVWRNPPRALARRAPAWRSGLRLPGRSIRIKLARVSREA